MLNLRNTEKILLGSFHGTGSDAEDLTLVSTLRDSIIAGFDLPANQLQQSYKHIHDFESFEYQGPGTPSAPSTKTLLGQSFSQINRLQDLAHGKTSMELNIEQAVTDFGERIQASHLPVGRKVRLVLQGWSRGAASALAVAQQLARQYPKTDYDYEIDLYLFEPCVGPTQRDFCWDVPDNVKQLQVFSNVDENNPVFISPKLKVLDTEQTVSKHYLMRGRHSSGVKGKTIGKADKHVFLTTMDIACTDLLTSDIPVDCSQAFYARTASINGHGHNKLIEKGLNEKTSYELLKSVSVKVKSYQEARKKKYEKTYPYANSLAYDLLVKNNAMPLLEKGDRVRLEKLSSEIYTKLNKIASCQPELTKKRGDIINQDGRSIVRPNFSVSQHHAELFKSVARYTYAAMLSKTNELFVKEIEKELMGLYENKCYDVLLNIIKHIDLNPYDLKLRCVAEKLIKY